MHNLAKVGVEGSNPFARSKFPVAQEMRSSLPPGWASLVSMDLATVATILLVSGSGVHWPAGGRCAGGFELLHNPHVDRSTKKALAESMRQAGCLGRRPQPRRDRPRRQSDDEPPA